MFRQIVKTKKREREKTFDEKINRIILGLEITNAKYVYVYDR